MDWGWANKADTLRTSSKGNALSLESPISLTGTDSQQGDGS